MSEETRLKIWDQYDIPSEETLYWHCGPIRIWCKTISGELWIANKNIEIDQGADNEPIPPPEDISWSRYALQKNYQKMRFVPLFPNRPVVVKVEFPFYLTKDAEAEIYTRVPLWVRIDIVGTKNLSLFEVPTIKLSNTWFGTFTEGELCYWLSSGARRTIEPDSSRPYLAICPIHMINTAEEDLSVEKICLRVSNLSLFYDGAQLWSDETKVFYRGSKEVSRIDVTGKPPPNAPSSQLITSPRSSLQKGLVKKTFTTLKDFLVWEYS